MTTSKWVPIRDFFTEGCAFLAQFIVPIISVAVNIAGLPPGIANILRAIPAMISAAEIAIPESGSGAAKKSQVLASAAAFVELANTKLTGGAKVTFDTLRPIIESIIDNGVAAVNQYGKSVIADDRPSPEVPTVGSGINAPVDIP